MRTILFICTGNTCRSPMAEAIARDLVRRGELDGDAGEVFIASAGISAGDGSPITPETVDALTHLGIEVEDAWSKPLTAAMIEKADVVLAMTASHAAAARELVGDDPDQIAKISTLDPDADIPDPIGLSQSVYDLLAVRLRDLIPRRLEEVLQR